MRLLLAREKAANHKLIPYSWYLLELFLRNYREALASLSYDAAEDFEWQWFIVPKSLLRAQLSAPRRRLGIGAPSL